MHNWDMGAPYTSFVQQIDDAQNNETGATQVRAGAPAA